MAAASSGTRTRTPATLHGATVIVLCIGLLITAAATWTAASLNTRTENRLLHLQTQQAADVLVASVPNTQAPLTTAAQVAVATDGDIEQFDRYIDAYVGSGGQFVSASLWEVTGTGVQSTATVGTAAYLPATSAAARSLATRAVNSKGFVVTGILDGQQTRLGFAYALPGPTHEFVVYAEHVIPADKRSAVASNSAFADLHYAIYQGPATTPSHLLTTSFPHLPATGRTERATVPFGDTVLTLVTGPVGQLDGTLSGHLPWIFGVLGVLLTAIAALITQWLVRRRRSAERDAAQIRSLYDELDASYREQRMIAVTLQRALLPQVSPDIPGLEVAVRYEPGTRGMDIGGDWYSVVAIDERHFAFVIGDVSGRGINAASVMAALRFTTRTLILEGKSPEAVLRKCSSQVDIDIDGHFATVLVGIGDLDRHELTLANAGHLNPLLIASHDTAYVTTSVGVPLGIAGGTYDPVVVSTPAGSTLIAFTDGLVERRGESLDIGLQRLVSASTPATGPLDELLTTVITQLTDDDAEDDVAIVALRWMERDPSDQPG